MVPLVRNVGCALTFKARKEKTLSITPLIYIVFSVNKYTIQPVDTLRRISSNHFIVSANPVSFAGRMNSLTAALPGRSKEHRSRTGLVRHTSVAPWARSSIAAGSSRAPINPSSALFTRGVGCSPRGPRGGLSGHVGPVKTFPRAGGRQLGRGSCRRRKQRLRSGRKPACAAARLFGHREEGGGRGSGDARTLSQFPWPREACRLASWARNPPPPPRIELAVLDPS